MTIILEATLPKKRKLHTDFIWQPIIHPQPQDLCKRQNERVGKALTHQEQSLSTERVLCISYRN
eukprot:c51609_g1_i1 orf=22-213(-)